MIEVNEIADGASDLCKRFGIRRLGLFGSIARGEGSEGSDVDFYAEFDTPTPETMPGRYFGFIEAAQARFKHPIQVLTGCRLKLSQLLQI